METSISETHDATSCTLQISSDDHFDANEVGPKTQLGHQRRNKNTDNKSLSTKDLLCWSFQISKAMEFLASKNVYLIQKKYVIT